jgi:hypothetical protein
MALHLTFFRASVSRTYLQCLSSVFYCRTLDKFIQGMNRRSFQGGGEVGWNLRLKSRRSRLQCYEQEEAKERATEKRATAQNAHGVAGTAPARE